MDAACVIPAYHTTNAELEAIFSEVGDHFSRIAVVVNDETIDPSRASMIEKLCPAPLSLVEVEGPLGKGEAVRLGLERLLIESDADVFVQMDAHQKQPPGQVARLVDRLAADSSVGMVVANRYGVPFSSLGAHRVTVSTGFSRLVHTVTGYELTDTVCGTRAYRRRLAALFAEESFCFGYGLELEQLFLASSAGHHVGQEPMESARQAETTAAEKIEDNLTAIITHARRHVPRLQKALLHRALAGVKQRSTFTVDGQIFGFTGAYHCEFVGPAEDDEESYKISFIPPAA